MTAHQAPRKSYFPYSRVVIYSNFALEIGAFVWSF